MALCIICPVVIRELGGGIFNWLRIVCVRNIFKHCGQIETIDTHVFFGNGHDIEIGDKSGIGAYNKIPNNIRIGNYVMMGPDICIFSSNHRFDDITLPMCEQGIQESLPTIIEDDVWIGARVIMTPGRYVRKGTIVGAGAVLTKDYDEYSIVGGNPAKLLKSRKQKINNNVNI